MNDGKLIMCPTCYLAGKKQILGKVQNNGDLLVLRFHHGTTLIQADNYKLTCGCGYYFSVSGTVVTNQYGKEPMHYGGK
jgi:hypothetical protein